MTPNEYVVYYRRSRKYPRAEQETNTRRFVAVNDGKVLAEFTENESTTERRTATGQRATYRPELQAAVEAALASRATLVIPRLGRLSRNTYVTALLRDSGVEFVACDMPKANHLTVHVLAALADKESRRISERTKAALVAAKARGVKLGSNRPGHWKGRHRGTKEAIVAAAKAHRDKTRNAYAYLIPEIKVRRERGDTLPEIVEWLNQTGHTTTVGMPFTQTAVWRLIKRYLGDEWLGNNIRKMAHVRR
jgi:DNA invertase Pin-like site-specific DNA recombinase